MLGCWLSSESTSCIYVVIYRPSTNRQMEPFFKELELLLKFVLSFQGGIVIWGDFNIHVNKPADNHPRRFRNILEWFGLVQLVEGPTRRSGVRDTGNTLDLVIVRRHCQPTTDCDVQAPHISDHSFITCRFSLSSLTAEDRGIEATTSWTLFYKVTIDYK